MSGSGTFPSAQGQRNDRFEMQSGPDRQNRRGAQTQQFGNHLIFQPCLITKSKIDQTTFDVSKAGDDDMNSNAVLKDVRRYRAIASLYRQTAALRPLQRASLLGQADEWEHLAIETLEAYFADVANDPEPIGSSHCWMQSEMMATSA
jgi:hypothetical protein